MRKTLLLMALALALGLIGCGKRATKPVAVTPQLEAEQKQAEQNARNAESARKTETQDKTQAQSVFEAESARQKR